MSKALAARSTELLFTGEAKILSDKVLGLAMLIDRLEDHSHLDKKHNPKNYINHCIEIHKAIQELKSRFENLHPEALNNESH